MLLTQKKEQRGDHHCELTTRNVQLATLENFLTETLGRKGVQLQQRNVEAHNSNDNPEWMRADEENEFKSTLILQCNKKSN